MQKIAINQLGRYAQNQALFFHEGALYTPEGHDGPFVLVQHYVDAGADAIIEAFLWQELLLVVCGASVVTTFPQHHPAKWYVKDLPDQGVSRFLGGVQWLFWVTQTRFCSRTGEPLAYQSGLCEKRAVSGQQTYYPSLAPAVLVVIKKLDTILLARSAHFAPGVYSALAGFVDLGETAEQAVHREVREEVGVQVKNVRYFGSQSWPFPGSFMMAFTAEYAEGVLTRDPNELEDAGWFGRSNLPDLPVQASLSRRLIEHVLLDLEGC